MSGGKRAKRKRRGVRLYACVDSAGLIAYWGDWLEFDELELLLPVLVLELLESLELFDETPEDLLF